MSKYLIVIIVYALIGTVVAVRIMSHPRGSEEDTFFGGVAWPLVLWMLVVYKLSDVYTHFRG